MSCPWYGFHIKNTIEFKGDITKITDMFFFVLVDLNITKAKNLPAIITASAYDYYSYEAFYKRNVPEDQHEYIHSYK